MEKRTENELEQWIDNRMAVLQAPSNGSPHTGRAFERLNAKIQTTGSKPAGRGWMAAAVSIAIGLVLAALPWHQLKVMMKQAPVPAENMVNATPVYAPKPLPPAATSSVKPAATLKPREAAAAPQAAATPAKVIKTVAPLYTDEARQAHIQGTVLLKVVIHKEGNATVSEIVNGLGYGLDEQARISVEQSQFQPATENGKPVDTTLQMSIAFKLY